MRNICLLVFLAGCLSFNAFPAGFVYVDAGDTQGLKNAIQAANSGEGPSDIIIRPAPDGTREFVIDQPFAGTRTALGWVTADITISSADEDGPPITFRPSDTSIGEFRLVEVTESGMLQLDHFIVRGFGVPDGSGGAILVDDQARLIGNRTTFRDNAAGGSGGAIAVGGEGNVYLYRCELTGNHSASVGGGLSIEGQATGQVRSSQFSDNRASVFGCDINVSTGASGGLALQLSDSLLVSDCTNVLLENPFGWIVASNNTIRNGSDGIDSTDLVHVFSNLFDLESALNRVQARGGSPSKPEALCNDFGTGAFQSRGFNIAEDTSCNLDHPSDIAGVDPMIEMDGDGWPVPQPGSPAIDSGAIDAWVPEGETLAVLPCGYRDPTGTARPQDANGDGVYECDRGAIEVPGTGQVLDAHSAVFYNTERAGEGSYVEVLDDGRAVIYTFSYTPDGSGPAWFIGVGEQNGNALIMDEIFRPVGAAFGDGFDPAAVEMTPAGSMSMVFSDCQSNAPGGNVVYTGEPGLGYEALVTRAARLSHITGCGAETPHPNAGLSGSWFDVGRSGEGVIVQWLTNGDVLAMFFTYDPDGKQFWLFGQAQAVGQSVTIDAVYPAAFTPWGRGFVSEDVELEPWGTMTLEWTGCDTMTFSYDSQLPGFGSATRDYVRLSKLKGTSCPQ